MIPRSQHFGDRAPFPLTRSGIMRIFEQPRFEALVIPAEGRAHYAGKQPNASVEQGQRRHLAARQDDSRRSRPARSSRASNRRSSIPSNRPHRMIAPGPAASVAHPRLGQRRARAGVIASSGTSGRRATASSTARARTSARITIPAPPPAGVSSTVRCRSVAKSRICTASQRPLALRQRPPGEAVAERAGEHLRVERQDGGGEGHAVQFSTEAGYVGEIGDVAGDERRPEASACAAISDRSCAPNGRCA